ncbi:MAG: KdsC family phosphatase [Candidatus Kariarchaeaceae archaeon]|jgi:YrbI family 3-deoxy-D-manno-octulosonate 8-phosphate phosphatase
MIRVVTCDVDGSITDSGIYYFSSGMQARKFSTYDGEGFGLLKKAGIAVSLVSQSQATEIVNRAAWLDIPFDGGIYDKAVWLAGLSKYYNIPLDNFAHFGNDINDLEAMTICGFSGCPSDAHPEVEAVAEYVCERKGGEGAFREFVDVILNELS